MDLAQMEYFVRVAELGSFTRAAIVLDVAQPALSRQIRLLEVELRQSLLIRNGRGVSLTPAGKLLLEHSRGILRQVERAREELDRVRGALTGRVAVGLPPSLGKRLTVPLTRAFRQRLPEASLCVREALTTTMAESLASGRLDIALLYNPRPSPELECFPLLEEDLYLVEPAGHACGAAIALAEVAERTLIMPSRPNALRMLVDSLLASIGKSSHVPLEIDGVSAILDLVADGAGAAVLPLNAVSASGDPERFSARPIIDPPVRSLLSLAISAHRPATMTQRMMVELIQEVVHTLMPAPAAQGTGARLAYRV